MNTSTSNNIPKTFWHALSICMLAATFGIIFIAYRSSTVSIEIADTKINLYSAIATAKDIKRDLEQENERLKKVNEELQSKLQSVRQDVAKVIQDPVISPDLKEILRGQPLGGEQSVIQPIAPRVFEKLETQIQQAEKAIESR